VREDAVPAREIDDAPTTKQAPDPLGEFPCLEQFFAWKTAGVTRRARHAMEECVVRESIEIAIG
jgi:hypothetical protein